MPGVIDVIEAKRDGNALTFSQINEIVVGYTDGIIPDYQMSSFLMAVYLRGMNDEEAISLTKAMLETGDSIDLSNIPGPKLDKHSTGGVGDKISLAFVPILAAAGVSIAKMSGRGLGHSGGTLDKLESITGFQVKLSVTEIVRQVSEIGGCICAQTESIVPADKKMYALRDVTGTVESIPLIAASIMSKKVAGGADTILIDVKVGKGAFVKDLTQARRLSNLMRTIGAAFDKNVICELTPMDAPIGQAVGNLMEVVEATRLLQKDPVDHRFLELVTELANNALFLCKSSANAKDIIASGSAWNKFIEIVEAQGGDINSIARWNDVAPIAQIVSTQTGNIAAIDAEIIGRASLQLGAGRAIKEEHVDPLAGIWLNSVVGTSVSKGDTLATLYGTPRSSLDSLVAAISSAYVFGQCPAVPAPIILESIPVGALQ
jgi:pyrimidine-nucleoside phosphorylase